MSRIAIPSNSRRYRASTWAKYGRTVNRSIQDPGLLKGLGLDWTAQDEGLRLSDLTPVTTHKAIIRSDNRDQIGIVGVKYQALQNQTLVDFAKDVAGIKEMNVEDGGAINNGSHVWFRLQAPDLVLEKGEDFSQGYLLLQNAHDGSSAVSITPMFLRLICSNGMRIMTRSKGTTQLARGYRLRHTSGLIPAMAEIAEAYARTMADFETTRAAFSALTSKPLSKEAFEAMMTAAFGEVDAANETERSHTIAQNRRDKIDTILASPTCNVIGTAGTLWSGLNAITEYLDHEARTTTRKGEDAGEKRFISANFGGQGDRSKEEAVAAALTFA